MAHGAPDWIRLIEVAVEVNLVPEQPVPANERAAGDTGRYTGVAQTYQTVASWTVATGKVGDLKEILLLSNNWDRTVWQITVGAVVFATEWTMLLSMPILFVDLKLAAATVVKVEAKSSDGSSITVDACITAKEIG